MEFPHIFLTLSFQWVRSVFKLANPFHRPLKFKTLHPTAHQAGWCVNTTDLYSKVPGFNLARTQTNLTEFWQCCRQSVQANAQTVPPTSFPSHYSSITLPFNATWSEVLTVLFKKAINTTNKYTNTLNPFINGYGFTTWHTYYIIYFTFWMSKTHNSIVWVQCHEIQSPHFGIEPRYHLTDGDI